MLAAIDVELVHFSEVIVSWNAMKNVIKAVNAMKNEIKAVHACD